MKSETSPPAGCGTTITTVQTWPWAGSHQNSGWPWPLNVYFRSPLKRGGLPSERVIRALKQIIEWRGRPNIIRCDNGPENISAAIQLWAEQSGIAFQYIQPGKPQQNAYVERFNRTVRYEWLSQYYWKNLDEVRDFATRWMWHYNHNRPNMALGGITPKQRLAMAA